MAELDSLPTSESPPAPAPAAAEPNRLSVAHHDRDAVLFVPGLGSESTQWIDQSSRSIATQFAAALGRQNPTARFRAEANELRQCHEVLAAEPGRPERNVLDVYVVDYHRTFVSGFESSSLLWKCLHVFVATAGSARKFFPALFGRSRRGKTFREKLQFALLALLLSLSWVYLIVLGVAVAETGWRVVGPALQQVAGPQPDGGEPSWVGRAWDQARAVGRWLAAAATPVVVFVTAVGVMVRPRLKEEFVRMMTNYYSAYDYLTFGDGQLLVGLVAKRVQEVTAAGGYRDVHLVGYSFGCVVTLNSLFPRSAEPLPVFSRVATLVTIGNPVDVVRTFWPRYLKSRCARPAAPRRWLNVFSMDDILSSNFGDTRSADRDPDPEVVFDIFSREPSDAPCPTGCGPGPTPENIPLPSNTDSRDFSWAETIKLYGVKAHAGYWNSTRPEAPSCFDEIVRALSTGGGGGRA